MYGFSAVAIAGVDSALRVSASSLATRPSTHFSASSALNPYIGYDRATEIVKEAVASKRTIREVALEHGVDEETLDRALDLRAMARGSKPG